jgi:hypothetical protein
MMPPRDLPGGPDVSPNELTADADVRCERRRSAGRVLATSSPRRKLPFRGNAKYADLLRTPAVEG